MVDRTPDFLHPTNLSLLLIIACDAGFIALQVDALSFEEVVVWGWVRALTTKLVDAELANLQ
jgi:hypothetical protein